MWNMIVDWIRDFIASWFADEISKRTGGGSKGQTQTPKSGGDDPKDSIGGFGLGDEAEEFNQAAGKLGLCEKDILTTRLDEIWTTLGKEEVERFRRIILHIPKEERTIALKGFVHMPDAIWKQHLVVSGVFSVSTITKAKRLLLKLIKEYGDPEEFKQADQRAAENIGNAGNWLDERIGEQVGAFASDGSPAGDWFEKMAKKIAGTPEADAGDNE